MNATSPADDAGCCVRCWLKGCAFVLMLTEYNTLCTVAVAIGYSYTARCAAATATTRTVISSADVTTSLRQMMMLMEEREIR